ncbi:hypothetical protein FRC04_001379 [Tulasnella sp. 424]|nr:hypothetical protein FRC04_001379 [Tulasnella sp. 424]KAG8968817.1 hypothetical protein FRC05_001303 [Tulasnella sp. 425]
MSADPRSSIPSSSTTSLSLPRTLRSNQYNLNSPRVPFRDSAEWASQPPKAGPTPSTTMASSTSGQARQQDTTSSPESKQRFRVPSSSNAINTIRSTLVALSDATAPAPRSKSKPRSKDPEDEDMLSSAYGFVEPPTLLYDTYSSAPPSYDEACFASSGSNHLQRQDNSSTADTIRSIARKVRKELVNGGR